MEVVAYDIKLLNVSKSSVTVPWSPVPINRRERPATGYRWAQFYLTLLDKAQREFIVGDTFVLYGSPRVGNSLRAIPPGKSVTLRLPAILSGSGYQDERNFILYPTPGLRAKVGMLVYSPDDPVFHCAREEFSKNTVSVRIAPTIPAVAEPPPDGQPPAIFAILPQSASPNPTLTLVGYRLGADKRTTGLQPRVHFSNDDVRLNATVGGSSYTMNNPNRGRQTLDVFIPAGISPGVWQVVVETSGSASAPFSVVFTSSGIVLGERSQSLIALEPDLELAGGRSVLSVDGVVVGPTQQFVSLYEGPDKPERFEAVQADDIELYFPIPSRTDLCITLEGRRRLRMRVERLDDYHVRFRLPQRLTRGPWRIVISASGLPTFTLPIAMYVHQRPQ